ncbi:hypothetical protein Daus18300_003825 [Diaporthe australafricana]|uniref:Uncharacterized protein n=1 Tax=Diaporthe australafricana TaxID=127596 RepID=A0ABR3XE20_9PEZI
MVEGLLEASKGNNAVSPHIYQKRLALNVVLMFCYGRRFEDIADPLLLGILGDAKVISRYGFFRDEQRATIANQVRGRRDKWLGALLEEAKESINKEGSKSCVASGLLTDKQENLTRGE